MAVSIPVFLSAPTSLNLEQDEIYKFTVDALRQEALLPRALGRGDYPQHDPLTEVYFIARACYGGLILGFSQVEASSGVIKSGTSNEKQITSPVRFPTPWNQIEAGLLLALRKPLLVFCQDGVAGGIFDQGAFSGFLQRFKPGAMTSTDWEQMRERVRHWSAEVRGHFRR